jgi:hypothetical protein
VIGRVAEREREARERQHPDREDDPSRERHCRKGGSTTLGVGKSRSQHTQEEQEQHGSPSEQDSCPLLRAVVVVVVLEDLLWRVLDIGCLARDQKRNHHQGDESDPE